MSHARRGPKIIGAVVTAALLLAACAPGTDALRQACANADGVLGAAYRSGKAAVDASRAQYEKRAATDPVGAQKEAEAAIAILVKVSAALDVASDSMAGICQMPDAIDAGQKKDVGGLIAALVPVVAAIQGAIHDLAPLLGK